MAGQEWSSAREIVEKVRAGTLTATRVAQHYLERIEQHDPHLHCFLDVRPETVLDQAKEVDARVERGDTDGALLGIPVAIKDNLCTTDHSTTCASQILQGYRSADDATVVRRIREAGGIVLGKTNLDEFAMGASTENSCAGPTSNPHDLKRVAGGSSGGSAAAVAAGLAPLALGSDTGGSVRQPASFCGVVGLRPSYGTVSRYGLIAFASSLDQVGPFALNVGDAAMLWEVVAGPDPRDSTCHPLANGDKSLPSDLSQLRVGVPREYHVDDVEKETRSVIQQCLSHLEERGATLVPVSLSLTEYSIPTYYLVVMSEASSNLSRFDGVRYGPRGRGGSTGEGHESHDLESLYRTTRTRFGEEVKRRIMLGTYALSAGYYDAYYKKALQVRHKIREEFEQAFEQADVLLGPTTPTPAFPIGEKSQDPLELYLCDVFTAGSALAGIPGISLPAGKSGDGLPIGAQIFGPRLSDRSLLVVAGEIEGCLGGGQTPVELNHGS